MPSTDEAQDTAAYRVDDRVRTAVAGLEGDAGARAAAWRQMIDLLCQPGLANDDSDLLIDAAMGVYGSIPLEGRRQAARAAAFGNPPPALIVLFANDRPTVSTELLAHVRLSDEGWREVLPQLTPVARGILRSRRDLGGDVRVALASFGPIDFVLPGTVEARSGGMTRISDLVARIEAFRQTRQAPQPEAAEPEPLESFRFEADSSGTIRWVDAAERSALVGIALSDPADGAGPGVDAGTVGAVRRRSAFGGCRLAVASDTPAGGQWRISAVPVFSDATGRFEGYRGTARRPKAHERAEAMAGGSLSADSLRQLVHELRTPLNAIGGFAELMERQLMGPVAAPYRVAAQDIGQEADRLLTAIEDLDTAARIDGRSLVLAREPVALDALVEEGVARFGGGTAILSVEGPAAIEADRVQAARLVNRLLGAVLPLAGPGEALNLALTGDDDWTRLAVDRPAGLDGTSEDDRTLLGFDFSMRLVRSLAHAMGGGLIIGDDRLTLSLPVAARRRAEDSRG